MPRAPRPLRFVALAALAPLVAVDPARACSACAPEDVASAVTLSMVLLAVFVLVDKFRHARARWVRRRAENSKPADRP